MEEKEASLSSAQANKFKALPQISGIKDKKKFLHSILDGVSGRPKDWKSTLGDKFENIKPLVDGYSIFAIKAVGLEYTGSQIADQLKKYNVNDEDIKIIVECLNVRGKDIRENLIKDASTISKTYLKDFDWKIQIVLADDKISSSRIPILRLSLELVNDDGTTKNLLLELAKEELDSLIDSLATANSGLRKLRA
eukprot:TRINITY_DN1164_c0_g1_i1.p1 TRINITY_DN1164_c0_g1~~TRINITY_DN1164_c0_g1_i1.p1  ORF type:complete len:201 (+),score=45.08 TRINITY_DN1164_c0_g1_i1:23-604(+)